MRKNCFVFFLLVFLSCNVMTLRVDAEDYCFFAESEDDARIISEYCNASFESFEAGIAVISADQAPSYNDIVFYEDQWISYDNEVFAQDANAFIPFENITGELDQWHLPVLHANESWQTTKGNVLVAVIDTGITREHPEFIHQTVNAISMIPEEEYGAGKLYLSEYVGPQDNLGHGTFVAGLIAAADDGYGTTGLSPNVSILSIKAMDKIGERGMGKTSWVASAVSYAIDAGAKVINLSLGGNIENDPLLHQVIQKAEANNVTVVCAAGNAASSREFYPAAYPESIAVSALRRQGKDFVFASSYSNYGPWIQVCAPGSNVIGPLPGGYGYGTGTSMASPLVASNVALLYSVNPDLTVQQVKEILQNTSLDLGTAGFDEYYGYGLINPEASLSFLTNKKPLGPPKANCRDQDIISKNSVIKLTTDSLQSVIYYTIDGTLPTKDSIPFPEQGISLPAGDIQLTAVTIQGEEISDPLALSLRVLPDKQSLPEEGPIQNIFPSALYQDFPRNFYDCTVGANEKLQIEIGDCAYPVSLSLSDDTGKFLIASQGDTLTWSNKDSKEKTLLLSAWVEAENGGKTYSLSISHSKLPTRDMDTPTESGQEEDTAPTEEQAIDNAIEEPTKQSLEPSIEPSMETPMKPSIEKTIKQFCSEEQPPVDEESLQNLWSTTKQESSQYTSFLEQALFKMSSPDYNSSPSATIVEIPILGISWETIITKSNVSYRDLGKTSILLSGLILMSLLVRIKKGEKERK